MLSTDSPETVSITFHSTGIQTLAAEITGWQQGRST